jgi:hypothetical protein
MTTRLLHFDGEDDTSKWDDWVFKMLTYAAMKESKEAF